MNKKIFYFAAFALGLIGLVSCEENEDFDPNYIIPNYFVGTWEHTQTGSLNSANVLYYDDVEKNENCEYDSLSLGADMRFTERDYSFDGSCTYVDLNGSYQIVDGNLVLTYDDLTPEDEFGPDVATLDVLALTNTNLEVSYTDEDTEELVFLKFTKL